MVDIPATRTFSRIPAPGGNRGDRHSAEAAAKNVEVLIAELDAKGCLVTDVHPITEPSKIEKELSMGGTRYQAEHDGRYRFGMTVNGHKNLVEMPGLPTHEVRWIDSDDQNIMDFPRLFINGSSWLWMIAVDLLAESEGDYQ